MLGPFIPRRSTKPGYGGQTAGGGGIGDAVVENSAFHVTGPTIPSAVNPLFLWNAMTAASVSGPNIPSATRVGDAPSVLSLS